MDREKMVEVIGEVINEHKLYNFTNMEFVGQLANRIADRLAEDKPKPRMMVCPDMEKCDAWDGGCRHCKPHPIKDDCSTVCTMVGHKCKCIPVESACDKCNGSGVRHMVNAMTEGTYVTCECKKQAKEDRQGEVHLILEMR